MWKPLWEIWPLINRLWTCKVVRVSTECHPVTLASAGEETASRSLSEWKLTQWPQKSHGAAGTRSHCPWGQMQRPELIASTPQGHSGRLRILKFIRLCGGKPQTTKISGAPSKEAERTQGSQFDIKLFFFLSVPPVLDRERYYGHPMVSSLLRSINLCTLWEFHDSSLDLHRGGAKFCSVIHIQDSMLMRIIIKRCRVGTSLLQSAPQQKQEGQRQRVRKAALLNALLDPISFGHFQHQAKPSRIVSFHRQAICFPTVMYLACQKVF